LAWAVRPGVLAHAEEIVRPMFTFLLVVHALIAAALVTVILMQRSEGGGLGMGGGPAGLMTARGAADFLTRATAVLATLFVLMAFLLAVLAARRDSAGQIDTSLAHQAPVGPITAPTPIAPPVAPINGIPMMGTAAPQATAPQAAPTEPAAAPKANRPAPTASSLKTIDTDKVANAKIGIGGVSTGNAQHDSSAVAPIVRPGAPAATKPTPTLDLAPPAPATGNGSSQPQ